MKQSGDRVIGATVNICGRGYELQFGLRGEECFAAEEDETVIIYRRRFLLPQM